MIRSRLVTVLGLLALSAPAHAATESAKFDAAMRPILDHYLKSAASLAADSDKGVADGARAIEKLCAGLPAVKGPSAARYAELPGKIKAAAAKVAASRDLASRRETFKELSRALVSWTVLSKPADLNVIVCSMAKAPWIQRTATIANPYYGSKMLRCGEIVSGPAKGKSDGHMKK